MNAERAATRMARRAVISEHLQHAHKVCITSLTFTITPGGKQVLFTPADRNTAAKTNKRLAPLHGTRKGRGLSTCLILKLPPFLLPGTFFGIHVCRRQMAPGGIPAEEGEGWACSWRRGQEVTKRCSGQSGKTLQISSQNHMFKCVK